MRLGPGLPQPPPSLNGATTRVLHLLGAAEDVGGILTVVRSLQAATGGRGCDHVAWVNAAYRETRQPALAYRLTRHLLDESPSPWRLLYGAVRSLKELRQLLAAEPYDVLHAHTRGAFPAALAVAAGWRWPLVLSLHTYARRISLYRWMLRRRCLRATILTPNMARHYRLAADEPGIRVISECCSDRYFELAMAERRRTDEPSRRIRLVGLGSVVREKNWHLVLDALLRLEAGERGRLEFHHWGPTPNDADARDYAAVLERRLAQGGLQPHCLFHGPTAAVEAALRGADWFILPSTNEPCSVALIEALALGVPAVVSASGGNLDIVRPGRTGLCFEPESADSLADCLRRVVRGEAQPGSPNELRESVRARSASAVAAQYLELYAQLRRS